MLPVGHEAEEEVGDEVAGVVSNGDGFEIILGGLKRKNGASEEPEAAADVGREAECRRGQIARRLALSRQSASDFTGEVRALLASRSANGMFWDWPGDTEVIMARKPG